MQEAYLTAYRSLNGFRGDAALSSWLVRIVVNESLGRLRKRKRDAEVIRLGHDNDERDVLETTMDEALLEQRERAALRSETRRLLEAKIDLLPEAFRTVFVLRAVEEMSVEETAARSAIPEPTVRSRFFRARGLLRESLAREVDIAVQDAFSFSRRPLRPHCRRGAGRLDDSQASGL